MTHIAELMLTLAHLATGTRGDGDAQEDAAEDARIALEIVHDGRTRHGVRHQAGLASALLLAALPEANLALMTLAEERGIAVVPSQEKPGMADRGRAGRGVAGPNCRCPGRVRPETVA